jgi:hypothetical protein
LRRILFIAAASSGVAAVIGSTISYQIRSERVQDLRADLVGAAELAVEALLADPSPEADGPDDPVQSLDGIVKDGVRLRIADISSAINANFTRKSPFENTELSRLLAPGKTAQELQQHREDTVLSPFSDAYAPFFTDEALDGQVTGYGWANINTTDEFALRSLVREATGSEAKAEGMRQKARSLMVDQRVIRATELPGFLGADFDDVFPFVNAEPLMNVNFVDAAILRGILGYEAFAIPNPAGVVEAVLSARMRGEIKPSDLQALIGVTENHILLHYFGCRTWFWEISAEKDGLNCVQVIARVPDAFPLDVGNPRYVLVDTRFSR